MGDWGIAAQLAYVPQRTDCVWAVDYSEIMRINRVLFIPYYADKSPRPEYRFKTA
jgi:hypothetical protein